MIALSLAEIARSCGGVVHGDPALVVDAAAYVDNRRPVPGGLFVAVAGERVDGHDYAAGAHAVLGTRATAAPTVVVDDSVVALGRLARRVADALPARLVALTGSQGKTGTKDLLAHVLAAAGPTVATGGNNNNELGVPLTVLRADAATDHLVVEMGARGIGHIAYLCEIAPPDLAAVLNVGTAHIGEFGGRAAIAAAKGEIVEALGPDGLAVLNADDDLVAPMAARTRARVLTFGRAGDVSWRGVVLDELGRAAFELGHDGAWAPVRLRQSGAHQVANAAAAGALALGAGLDLETIATSLSSAEPAADSGSRMQLRTRADGLLVVDDAYNANPASMRAALEALIALGAHRPGRTIACLGEMLELGPDAAAAHHEVGSVAGSLGVDVVLAVGEAAAPIAEGARQAGGRARGHTEVVRTAGRDEALAWMGQNARAGDVVLVKASHGAALAWLARELAESQQDAPPRTPPPTGPDRLGPDQQGSPPAT